MTAEGALRVRWTRAELLAVRGAIEVTPLFEGRADVVSLFLQNAGDDESALRFKDLGKFGRERDDYIRRQIGQNEVEVLAVIRAEFVDFDFDIVRHAVDGGVLKRHGDGFRIDIEAGDARSGPEFDRRDGARIRSDCWSVARVKGLLSGRRIEGPDLLVADDDHLRAAGAVQIGEHGKISHCHPGAPLLPARQLPTAATATRARWWCRVAGCAWIGLCQGK